MKMMATLGFCLELSELEASAQTPLWVEVFTSDIGIGMVGVLGGTRTCIQVLEGVHQSLIT